MKKSLIRAKLWDEESHAEALKTIIDECVCSLAHRPRPPPRVSLSSVEKGDEICIDIVYFEGIPHLHAEDKFSAFSACVRLKDRSIATQTQTLKALWIERYGNPKRITADSEYDKPLFYKFCSEYDIALSIVATEAHNQNGTIEAGNRVLRMFFRRIRLSEPQLNLEQVVEHAVFGKNCCTGSKGATSYELWLEKPPPSDQMILPIRAAFAAKQARAKIFRALKPGHRDHTDVCVGQYVRFYREKKGWSTPCQVVSVDRNMITVIHNNTQKTAGRTGVIPCDPPFAILLNPDECNLDFDEGIRNIQNDENSIIEPSTISPTEGQNVQENLPNENLIENEETALEPVIETTPSMTGSVIEPASSKSSRASGSAMVLRSSTNAQSESKESSELDQSQVLTFVSTHFYSSMPFTSSSKLAQQEEMAESYLQEKENWIRSKAFDLVKISDVPSGANIISSHVIYKWKSETTLKARIVPHGHRDEEKQFLRTDAPTMSVEVLRMIVSIAVENQWRIGSLDVKAAYLQATGFNRIIYVRPPKEDQDRNNLWKLEKPAYGLADSGRLWFLTAFRALESHGLRSCPYDKTIFASKNSLLFVTTQVDNFLFTGTHSEMMLFTDYMKAQFQLSELEYDNFCVYGTKFSRDKHGIRMSQRAKIMELQQFPLSAERRRMHEEPVTRAERLFYMSTVGSILFVGHVTSPIAARMAGVLASALPNLSVKDIKNMNAVVRKLHSGLPAIAELFFAVIKKSEDQPVWLTFSDASFSEDYVKNRAGVLVTRSFGLGENCPMHVIDFCSHKLRRVARSTKAAETLAASEGYDRAFYCHSVAVWMSSRLFSGMFLVLDNSSLYMDISTSRTPKEKRLKVDLALLREAFDSGALCGVIWAATVHQLADAMTKADEKSDTRLMLALGDGCLRHSYENCPFKISPQFASLNTAKAGMVKDVSRQAI
jgi:hypothetical protein